MVDAIWRDVRHALRMLRRTPGLTITAIVTLTLGLGLNLAIVGVLDAVVFKPLPVSAAGELVALYETAPSGDADLNGGTGAQTVFSYPRFEQLQRALGTRGELAATTRSVRFTVRRGQSARRDIAEGQLVSGSYFSVFRVAVVRGRILTRDDSRADRPAGVAVVSSGYAVRALGGVERAVGQTLFVNDLAVTIVGVVAPDFGGAWTDAAADMWLPLQLQQALGYRSNVSSYENADRNQPWVGQDRIAWLTLIARIPSGDRAAARAMLQTANEQGVLVLANLFSDRESRQQMLAHRLEVEPLTRGFSGLRDRFGGALLALSVLAAVVLLLTCANLTNLLLARASARVREVAIRTAVGATRAALLRQSMIESGVLAVLGGLLGLTLGQWAREALARFVLASSRELLPPVFAMDGRMLSLAALLTLATALLIGLLPAWRRTRPGHSWSGPSAMRDGLPMSALRTMRPFVVAQLAMSFVLVIVAVLFGRTLTSFARVETGLDPRPVVEVVLNPILSGYTPE